MDLVDKRYRARAVARAGTGATHQRLSPGEFLGEYMIVRRIYLDPLVSYYIIRKYEENEEIPVAIFHPEVNTDSGFPERLQKIIQLLGVTEELAICLIRKYEVIDDLHCVLFEPVYGRSLQGKADQARLTEQSGLGSEVTVHIIRQILAGLHDAHTHDIHHRGLDPCLVFQDEEGNIQVLGFGLYDSLGKDLVDKIQELDAEAKAKAMGVSGGENPELKVYKERLRRLSDDVYGTAILGYQLLQGHSPKYINGELSKLDLENLPPRWRTFFKKTLTLNPEKRMASLIEMDRRLDRFSEENSNGRWDQFSEFYDHLPVPPSIRKRGTFARRFYWAGRLSALLIGVGLISVPFLEPVAIDYVESRQPVAVQKDASEPFDLALNFLRAGATVDLVDYDTSFVVPGRQLLLDLRSGTYRIRVSAPGYLYTYETVTIERSTLDRPVEPIDVNFELQPLSSGIYVESIPNANIYGEQVTGESKKLFGQTNEYGYLLLGAEIVDSLTSLTVEKVGFTARTIQRESIQLGKSSRVNMDLQPIAAILSVESDPEGATVFLNGEHRGTAPVTIDGLDPDIDYSVKVELPGYHAETRAIDLGPDEFFNLSFGPMSRLDSGTFILEPNFESAPDSESLELVNAVSFQIAGMESDAGQLRLTNVPAGNHVLSVHHPLFESSSSRVVVRDGKVQATEVALKPKPGAVVLDVDPKYPVEYFLDNIPVNAKEGVIQVPAYKNVRVSVKIQDHFTMQGDFEVGPTENLFWDIEPVPLPSPEPGESWSVPYLGMKFVWVESGEQLVGSPRTESGRLPSEPIQYSVSASRGFWIGVYEVTQFEYQNLIGQNPSDFIGNLNPVDNVSWFDAMKYCARLNEIEAAAGRLPPGYAYQLPTELEWEFAARSGETGPFTFGNQATPLNGNFRGYFPSSYVPETPIRNSFNTVPVGSFKANNIGLYDLHGNIEEWTRDGFVSRRSGEAHIPVNINDDTVQVAVRGGSWQSLAMRCRLASRRGFLASERDNSMGFRIVIAPLEINVK